MRKFYSFLVALLTVCGMVQAQTTVTFTAGTDVYPSQDAGAHTLTKDGVTISVSNGTFGRTDNYRVYKGQTLTVAAEKPITQIALTCESSNPASNFTAIDGLTIDGSDALWTGSALSVELVASSAQVRISEIQVTTAPVDPDFVAAPAIKPATGTYYSAQEVTISAAEGTTVYYTLDGSAPSTSSAVYTAPFTVRETTTVKAIAVKGENQSQVAESVISIETLEAKTLAEIIADGAQTQVETSATVQAVYTSGLLVGDGTAFMTVYLGTTPEVAVGDVVTLVGATTMYGGCLQFAQGTKVTKTGTATVTYPEPQVLDGAAFDALVETPAVVYVKVQGVLTISGNYKNLAIEGATNVGSVQCTADVLGAAASGSEIEVTGFFAYKSGSTYGNIIATSIKVLGDNPQPSIDWTSSAEAPLTVAAAIEKASLLPAGGKSNEDVYVKGIVSEIGEISLEHGNATYYISDNGQKETQLYVYRGKSLKGENFTAEDEIKVGDEVIVVGIITNFVKDEVSTLEFTAGNKLYSINGKTEKEPEVYELEGAGELDDPYTIVDIQHLGKVKENGTIGWVAGYIVGYANGSMKNSIFSAAAPEGTDKDGKPLEVLNTNILLAPTAGEDDYTKCIPVQLSNKYGMREALSLKDVPANLGRKVWINGEFVLYFSVPGVKNVADWSFDGKAGLNAISDVSANAAAQTIYNLTGQRVAKVNRGGIYIVGGRKVLVK